MSYEPLFPIAHLWASSASSNRLRRWESGRKRRHRAARLLNTPKAATARGVGCSHGSGRMPAMDVTVFHPRHPADCLLKPCRGAPYGLWYGNREYAIHYAEWVALLTPAGNLAFSFA